MWCYLRFKSTSYTIDISFFVFDLFFPALTVGCWKRSTMKRSERWCVVNVKKAALGRLQRLILAQSERDLAE